MMTHGNTPNHNRPDTGKEATMARFSDSVRSAVASLSDWDLLAAVLHWNGSLRGIVGSELDTHLFVMCDGFGKRTAAELADMDWDWSHVRDSSDEAIARAASMLRAVVRADAVTASFIGKVHEVAA